MKEEHPEARSIVDKLKDNGYTAYYAGGWVRDYLLEYPSDDIDIATDAPPEVLQNLFEKTVPIGIAFGIILVLIEEKQFEVATFRADLEYKDGRRPTKIAFTSAEEDAKRRDFTINGMFYDPIKDEIIDLVGGKEDLKKKIIKAIGNAHERIQEDRLRMIRAIRLSCKFGFEIEEKTRKAIHAHSKELFPAVAIERVVQEFRKMATHPHFKEALLIMDDLDLLKEVFPDLSSLSHSDLEKRLEHLPDFPRKMPIIAYLLELFPAITLDKTIQLCKYLKLSKQEISCAQFLHYSHTLFTKDNPENFEWAYFYTNSFSTFALSIQAAHLPIEKRPDFEEEHEKRVEMLLLFITRIKENKPVVTSSHLIKAGVKPGKEMGALLAEAEKISINEMIEDPEKIIQKLNLKK